VTAITMPVFMADAGAHADARAAKGCGRQGLLDVERAWMAAAAWSRAAVAGEAGNRPSPMKL